jgi:hypothetical protein
MKGEGEVENLFLTALIGTKQKSKKELGETEE